MVVALCLLQPPLGRQIRLAWGLKELERPLALHDIQLYFVMNCDVSQAADR